MPFSNPIVGGVTLIRPAIQSPNYVAGVDGWSINKDGTAELNKVKIRGSGTTDALTVGTAPQPQVVVGSNANVGTIKFPTNRPVESGVSTILAGALNTGLPNEAATLQIFGPTVTGATGQASIKLNSQNNDGSSMASLNFQAHNAITNLNDTQLLVSGMSSGSSALFVQPTAGHTGNMMRLQKGAVDQFVVGNDGTITTVLKASNRVTGTVSITPPTANVPASAVITFPTALTGTSFSCQVTANTANPGTQILGVGYSALSSTGVTVWVTRSAGGIATVLSYTVEGF